MNVFSNIVVAIDGSAPSDAALGAACSLASDRGKITAVFVCEPLPHLHAHHIDWKYDDEVSRRSGLAALRRAEETAKSERGLTIETKMLEGDIVDEIVAYARKVAADAIVVGSHGRSGVQRLLVGSVAARLMRTSPIPVIVVARAAATVESDAAPGAV